MKLASLTLALLLSASTTFASEMCTNSLAMICKDAKAENAKQETYLKDLSYKIREDAAPRIQARTEAALKKIAKFRLIKRALTEMRIQQQEIMRTAQRMYPEINALLADKSKHEELKSYVREAIGVTDFAKDAKLNMHKILNEVQIVSFEEYIDIFDIDESLFKNMTMNGCGTDGLAVNAFAFKHPTKKTKFVVICPGLALKSQALTNKEDAYEDITFVIAHELGHHIDNGEVGNQVYANYLSCIARDHAQELVMTKKTEKVCKKSSQEECRVANTLTHARELVSDVWGFKALNVYRARHNYNILNTEDLIKSNLQFLCNSSDEGTHASGDFRVGIHLQMNQDVKEALSCQDSQVKTCSF